MEGGVMNCSICGELIGKEASGWTEGHNAYPINEGRCCGTCNDTEVLPARLETYGYSRKDAKEVGETLRKVGASKVNFIERKVDCNKLNWNHLAGN